MGKDTEIIEEKSSRPQNANLTPGGPGRPKGQLNYSTLYKQAMLNIAKANGKTLEEIEVEFQQVGLKHAFKGDFRFWKDINDRNHGKTPEQRLNVNVNVEPNERIKQLAEKLNYGN